MEASKLCVGARKIIKCNTCNWKTNHELKAIYTKQDEDDYNSNDPLAQPSWWVDYQYCIWACLGCNTAVFEEVFTPSFSDQVESSYYPDRNPSRENQKLIFKNFVQLDAKLTMVYREVVQCYNAGLKITCAMGLRALLEGICVNKGITDDIARPLGSKLEKLGERLPSNIVKSLYSFKFIGDDAAHRLDTTSKEELKLAIDVMEDLLNFLYEMEYQLVSKAQKLADKRPRTKIAEVKQEKILKSKNTET
jgi:hypothetical protein